MKSKQENKTKLRLGGLDSEESRAWGGLLRTHLRLTRLMDAELRANNEMPLTHYDVLRQVGLAPDRRIRLAELADRVMLTRGGLTGIVDRLEADGLLRRERATEDRRGLFAKLTPKGADRLQEAQATHLRSIKIHFAGRLSRTQLRDLAAVWARLDTNDQDE